MAYSHSRLRNTLALVRTAIGAMFLLGGWHKISSLEFARIEFPKFLAQTIHGAAVGFYADFLTSFVGDRPGEVAVLLGFTELFIGVGLLLGLAVRPLSLLGMFYTLNFMLATCMAPGSNGAVWQYVENETKLILMFFLFLLFGVGHAGENWGVGALYHHHRHRRWEKEEASAEAEASARFDSLKVRYFDNDFPATGRDRARRGSRLLVP
jgi:uncharacterized membrane protein YphA (DoxX/SURF4 family)